MKTFLSPTSPAIPKFPQQDDVKEIGEVAIRYMVPCK